MLLCLCGYQVLIPELLPFRASRHCRHLVCCVKRSAVVSACELVDVAVKVLDAHVMIHAVIAAFQACPVGLHTVGVRHAPNVLGDAVLNGLMGTGNALIGPRIVGIDHRVRLGVALYEPLQCRRVGRFDNLTGDLAGVSVLHADDRRLADGSAPGVQLLRLVLIPFLPADVCLIDLDRASELIARDGQGLTNAVRHVPCRLQSDTEVSVELHARHAFEVRHIEVEGNRPLVERDVGAMQDCTSLDGEVLAAISASEGLGLATGNHGYVQAATVRAGYTVRPALLDEPRLSLFDGVETLRDL